MAGTKITMPANGSTDWSDFVTITQHSYRHMSFVSFTNTTSTGVPAIEAGSYGVVNGTMYSFTPSTGGNETISTTGLSTGFTGGELWVKAIPTTGSSITSEFTTIAPTWSASKGGYYSTGNEKYLGGVYKTTALSYGQKWTYQEGIKINIGGTRPILSKQYALPAWDMDAVQTIYLALDGFTEASRIINLMAFVRSDGSANLTPIDTKAGGYLTIDKSNNQIILIRVTGGDFDNVNYDSTAISRGEITMDFTG